MSALAGIFNLDGRPVTPTLLHAMADAARERGPDADGYWLEGVVGMAFRLLATTPEAAHERQPWSSADGNLKIVFDGRIDNRAELTDSIKVADGRLDDTTDVELVGRCFELWGEETWNRLMGDFAIVAMDRRRRKMFCARDPMGLRPLHYSFDGKTFLFASDLIQIVEDPRITRTPNEEFLAECLAGGPFTRRETVIRNVFRLEGGTCLTVSSAGIRHRQYYDLAAAKPLRFANYDDCAAALRDVLTEAVRCRMRAPGDVASHLSGGLDSSSIVSIAHDLARRGEVRSRVRPFSLVFTDPDADENEFIAEVERHLNLSTERRTPFAPDIEYLAEYSRKTLELPRYPNATMTDGLEGAVVSRALRVCLSGLGGDNTMDGAADDLAAVVRGVHPIRFARALRDLRGNIASGDVRHGFIGVALRSAIWPLVPPAVRGRVRRMLGRDYEGPSYAWLSWVDPSFAERHGLADSARAADNEWGNRPVALHAIWYLLHDGWFTYAMEGNERNAARAGLEYRYPFCDRRVIEFVCGLAEEQRWNQGVPRLLMRRAMRGILTEAVRNRSTKAHFDDFGMRQLKRLGDSLAGSLTLEKTGWIGGARLREAEDSAWLLYQSHDQRYADLQWNLFAALSIEIFLRNLQDGPTAPVKNLEQPSMEAIGTCH